MHAGLRILYVLGQSFTSSALGHLIALGFSFARVPHTSASQSINGLELRPPASLYIYPLIRSYAPISEVAFLSSIESQRVPPGGMGTESQDQHAR
jgi:hypothetical protein